MDSIRVLLLFIVSVWTRGGRSFLPHRQRSCGCVLLVPVACCSRVAIQKKAVQGESLVTRPALPAVRLVFLRVARIRCRGCFILVPAAVLHRCCLALALLVLEGWTGEGVSDGLGGR